MLEYSDTSTSGSGFPGYRRDGKGIFMYFKETTSVVSPIFTQHVRAARVTGRRIQGVIYPGRKLIYTLDPDIWTAELMAAEEGVSVGAARKGLTDSGGEFTFYPDQRGPVQLSMVIYLYSLLEDAVIFLHDSWPDELDQSMIEVVTHGYDNRSRLNFSGTLSQVREAVIEHRPNRST